MAKVFVKGPNLWVICPGCRVTHRFTDKWEFNGDSDSPTFKPRLASMTIRADSKVYCLARIENGHIQFDPTSHHELAGSDVVLPEWDDPAWEPLVKSYLGPS